MDCLNIEFRDVVSLVKDIILALAPIAGVCVAFHGLSTWKRQHRGQIDFELARNTLTGLYRYRDAIKGVRHPLLTLHEQPSPPPEKEEKMSPNQLRHFGIVGAYQARWDIVNDERQSLNAYLIEAEAIWDNGAKDLFRPLFNLEHELFRHLQLHIQIENPETDDEDRRALTKIFREQRDILYDPLTDEGDDFRKEFDNAVTNFENYLRPKLRHRL